MTQDLRSIEIAKEVLNAQSEALLATSARLDQQFDAAVAHILKISGKVVTTGLGKSGHVARKLAATLSSTGTPAAYLHPAEAMHGDLGLVSSQDVVIAIAFGGETQEVINVCEYARRHDLKVIAIAGKQTSSLAKLADYSLDGSIAKEACPHNLAPTVSTTVALALGDCLAMALMQIRGFSSEDFARFHPGGSLGRRLSSVSELMRAASEIDAVNLGDSFHTVLEKVTKHNFGICAVLDGSGELAGVVTDGDVRRALVDHEEKVFSYTVEELMSKNPKTIDPDQPCLAAFQIMEQNNIISLLVTSKDQPKNLVGIIRMYDLLAAKIV